MKEEESKPIELEICPQCGKKSLIVSVFGSICKNEECFYEVNH